MSRVPPSPPGAGEDAGKRATGGESGAEPASPSELAREALRRLALQRVAPTPDNYRAFYHRIAGTVAEDVFPEKAFKTIVHALPRNTPSAVQLAQRLETAVASGQWPAFRQAIVELVETSAVDQPAWAALIRELVAQYERAHAELSAAHKRDALLQVLNAATGIGPGQLHQRLQALIRGWADAADGGMPTAARRSREQPAAASGYGSLQPLLVQLLNGIPSLVAEDEALGDEARTLAEDLSSGAYDEAHELLAARIAKLIERIGWAAEDQRAIRQSLLGLLQLIIDNIRELVVDDGWLRGQLSVLVEAFAGPLDIRVLDEVERRLRDVIDKQSRLKSQLDEAQNRLKHMLAGFVDQLAHFSSATGDYHDHLERSAERISAAKDIGELTDVVEELLAETRNVQETARRSGEELAGLREQVDAANRHIARLQLELDHTSELVRHDPLTGALNRKGLDEALAREIARARRRNESLSIALLDVDNFKQINDTFGHGTGDDALRYLVGVVREALRTQDSVGRYGGEEFLIILPDTEVDQAIAILTRLQRELTRRFFLADQERLLITFSAGIASLGPDEDPTAAIDRADKAMYAAKRAGKNRVFASN